MYLNWSTGNAIDHYRSATHRVQKLLSIDIDATDA